MKVCVVGTRGFPGIEGGVEKHCELLYPNMGKETEIIVFRRKPFVTEDVKHSKYENVRFIDLPTTTIKGFEALIHSFLATVKAIQLRPDVVHFHNIGPGLFIPLAKLFGLPTVLTYHSPNYEHKKWNGISRGILKLCEKISMRFADRIIFVNAFQMGKYPETILRKSQYIPNGVPPLQISACHDYLDKIGVEPGKYVLSVGRITPEKEFHTLIAAFKHQNVTGYKLVIAGGVEFESGYMEKLQKLSQGVSVVFTGYITGDALEQLYSHAALFVLASANEGFPMVLLEAMGYQRDVLVSDIPATHLVELEQRDYFAVGDVETLSAKMEKRLSNPVLRHYDLHAYDWSKIAESVSAALKSVAEQ